MHTHLTLLSIARSALLPALFSGALLGCQLAHGQSGATAAGTVATVNGVPISQARFDLVLKEFLARGQQDTPALRDNIKQELINAEIVTQEAVRQGLDKDPEFTQRMALAREQLLVQFYSRKRLDGKAPSEDELKAQYEEIKAQAPQKEYLARHILLKTEAEAKSVIAQLQKGARFEKLASEQSQDAGSKENGGELGWQSPGNLVKPFADALASLKKDEITKAPVQTTYGWHVIKLEDERAPQLRPYDQVRGALMQRRMQQLMNADITELRAKAKIIE